MVDSIKLLSDIETTKNILIFMMKENVKTLSINGCTALGPLDENPAIIGAGFVPVFVVASDK